MEQPEDKLSIKIKEIKNKLGIMLSNHKRVWHIGAYDNYEEAKQASNQALNSVVQLYVSKEIRVLSIKTGLDFDFAKGYHYIKIAVESQGDLNDATIPAESASS